MNLMNKITIVTGIWDLKRDTLTDGWNRSFQHYLNNLEKLMKTPENMIIFIEKQYEDFVWQHRTKENTFVITKELDWFKNNGDLYDKIQKIRLNPDWYNQSGWLPDSTQAKLEMYNPVVMSKVFLLNDASILDPFNSSHLIWVDGGLTNTVHEGYFWHDKVIQKLDKYFDKFSFVCFPYDGKVEIHGFRYDKICEYSGEEVERVARGGIFGGPKHLISDINRIYYDILNNTLSNGYMGTEESIFTIMTYKYPEFINYYEIESNGLLGTFFENLKNDNLVVKSNSKIVSTVNLDINKVGLYVITFNSPKQFETLIQSMIEYDRDFIDKPKKFLLDNSTDLSTTPRYKELCDQYGFEHIKKDNLGIVGGRVFVAEHFDETGLNLYYHFEDDMSFYPKKGEVCRNGFSRYVDNLYQKSLEIIKNENFDFLKLNFSEYYGDNSVQWSWYNTPQNFRQSHWPNKPNLPVQGLDPNAPNTEFKHIKTHRGLPYSSGEIYLCNWPIVLTKEGNYKCYLETKFAYPHEQTLMSYAFQETVKGNINPGILLLTPTEHNRFDHYARELRKEC
jgi:hypothetical protein